MDLFDWTILSDLLGCLCLSHEGTNSSDWKHWTRSLQDVPFLEEICFRSSFLEDLG